MAKLAAERGKPIVLIKIGRSELGARAARSHTAALTGADARYDAIFAQYGVIRVQDYDELLETAHLLAHTPKPRVPGIAVVSHSGGISSLTADMCGQAGLDLPPLGDEARDGINGILKGFGWAANPADVTGFANSESFPQIMEHMINDPRMGTLVVASAGADAQAQQVIKERDRTDKGVVFLWTGSRDAKAGLAQLKRARIPIFYTPDKLARGLRSRLAYHTWRERRLADGFATAPPRTAPQDQAIARALALGRPTLSESESKRAAGRLGRGECARAPGKFRGGRRRGRRRARVSGGAQGRLAGYSAQDGGRGRSAEPAAIWRKCEPPTPRSWPMPRPMHQRLGSPACRCRRWCGDGVEVIIGVSCDPQLGPVLLFGSGGVMVEVYNDVALRRCPITRAEARAMIAEVKGARLLQGFRGRPAADLEALADTLVRVSYLAMHIEGHLAELDINPLMVLPSGQGVKAVDALVVFRST